MSAWVLVIVLGSHQGVYTGGDVNDKAVRFRTYEQCEVMAQAEVERLQKARIGTFQLACVPADGVVADDE